MRCFQGDLASVGPTCSNQHVYNIWNLLSPPMKIWKAAQNIENGVVW